MKSKDCDWDVDPELNRKILDIESYMEDFTKAKFLKADHRFKKKRRALQLLQRKVMGEFYQAVWRVHLASRAKHGAGSIDDGGLSQEAMGMEGHQSGEGKGIVPGESEEQKKQVDTTEPSMEGKDPELDRIMEEFGYRKTAKIEELDRGMKELAILKIELEDSKMEFVNSKKRMEDASREYDLRRKRMTEAVYGFYKAADRFLLALGATRKVGSGSAGGSKEAGEPGDCDFDVDPEIKAKLANVDSYMEELMGKRQNQETMQESGEVKGKELVVSLVDSGETEAQGHSTKAKKRMRSWK